MTEEVPIQSRDYWFKVIEMLQQNWALIDADATGVVVYFFGDTSGVCDQMRFQSQDSAMSALQANGFRRFADDASALSFLRCPRAAIHSSPPLQRPDLLIRALLETFDPTMRPTKKTKLQDLWSGIRRHPWRTVVVAFAAFSVLWTLTEAVTHFLPGIKIEGGYALTIIIAFSIFYSLNRIWKPSRVTIKVATTNTVIEVIFGDLFAQDGLKAIAVSEFFESEIGVPVSDTSLQGIFLKKYFGGGVQAFDKQVNEQLKRMESTQVTKAEGKSKSFPIGTTALVQVDGKRFIMFALAKTEPATCKAYSDVTIVPVQRECPKDGFELSYSRSG